MTSVTYYGHVTMTYMDYIDLGTGKTLVCQPGQTYNIVPASGNPRSAGMTMPNDGRFSANNGREAELGEEEERDEITRAEDPSEESRLSSRRQ